MEANQKFIWSTTYSVGNNELDDHHRKLFELISMFESQIQYAPELERCLMILADLKNYTHMHFEEEENFMERIHYPQLKEHKKLHQNLFDELLKFEKSKKFTKQETSNFLRNWISTHILEEDMEYARWLKR